MSKDRSATASPGSHLSPRTTMHPALALVAFVLGVGGLNLVALALASRSLRLGLMAAELAFITPGLVTMAFFGLPLQATLALRPVGRRLAVLGFLLGGSLWVASLGVVELQSWVWPPPPAFLEGMRRLLDALRPRNPIDGLLSVIAIAVMPALAEEGVLRGLVLPSLRTLVPAAPALVVSALLFAAIHDPPRYLFTFTVGLVLGVLRLRTGTLVVPMLAHATLNTITFLLAPLVDDPDSSTHADPLLGLALLVVGGAATTWLIRKIAPSVPA